MSATKEQFVERVEALLPAIAARARESEMQRHPLTETINDLIEAEIFQTLVPKVFGGHELNLDAHAAIVRAISSADMSTGWVSAFYIGHNWMLTKFSEQVQREVFAERPFGLIPIQPTPAIEIKPVTGGYEISGRSNFSSGIMNADWVIVTKAGGSDARAFVVPIADCQVDDVWFMSGMAGTGSNDVIVENLFVPEYRTLPAAALFNSVETMHSNPVYAIPLLPFIYCEVMGVYCGGLAAATAAFDGHLQAKNMTWGGDALAGKQATHINLGEAYARSRAAEMLYERLIADTMGLARTGDFSADVRVDLKLRAGYIADLCRSAVNDIMARAGTRNFALDVPLQRFFRDMNTLASHAFIDWDVSRELYGRHRLGMEPNNPLV